MNHCNTCNLDNIVQQLYLKKKLWGLRRGKLHKTIKNKNGIASQFLTVIQSWLVESTNVKPMDMKGPLYSLYYIILYKGLEQSTDLVSVGAPGTDTL